MLDPDTIRLGYQLILDRAPSPAEVSAGQAAFADTSALRQAFLKSREFHRKFSLISQAAEDARIPALVQLMIPGTGGDALRDQLLAHPGLQQAFELDDPRAEALRQMPPGDQRALRYVYGDLSYGVGAGLEGPHFYVTLLGDPGPRLHRLWQLWGADSGFGAFLETALDDPALRAEIDNGQIRRLAGNRSGSGLGQERDLLQTAWHVGLGPDLFLGFDTAPGALIGTLQDNGLFAGHAPPRLNPLTAHPDYAEDCARLSPDHRTLFDGYTAWDGYCYSVCRQLLLPDPT